MTMTVIQNKQTILPSGWSKTKLGDICEKITKGSTPTSYGYSYKKEGIKFVKTENIDEKGNIFEIAHFIDEETNQFLRRSILQENDLLFSIAGTIGRVSRIKKVDLPANTNQALAIVRPIAGRVDTKYLFYYLKTDEVQKFALKSIVGVGRANLSLTNVSDFNVPLAPLNKQKLIVAEIEKHFSRLDEAVANLKRVKANLKRYKAAVLKAAVEGKLTEEWRKQHPDVEHARELLKHILSERKRKWEAEHPGKKYKEPTLPDSSNLPKLPKGWVWATIEQLATKVQYGSSAKTNEHSSGVPVLRMGNIFEGQLKLDELKYLPKNHPELPDLLLKKGDLLFNRTNSPELVGKTTVYMGKPKPCSFASYLIRVKMADGIRSNFVSFYINSVYGRKWIKTVVSQQVGQANVNGTKLQALLIPLPSDTEQQKIIEEVESRFSVTEEIEAAIEINLKRAERLRQSILKEAFSGKLV
jgi:type I restriction enzyme, S subunit